jgi:hypothetical protein
MKDDEHLEDEDVTPKNTSFELESITNDIPNQSLMMFLT